MQGLGGPCILAGAIAGICARKHKIQQIILFGKFLKEVWEKLFSKKFSQENRVPLYRNTRELILIELSVLTAEGE